MKPKYYETEEFNQLNREWRVKLKESGFEDTEVEREGLSEDAEQEFIDKQRLIDKRYNIVKTRQQTEEYFDLVCSHLHNGVFKNDMIKRIWELHSEGYSLSEIGKKVGLHKQTVAFHVRKTLKKARGL